MMIDKKKDILIVNKGGNYYVVCPWHGAKWDITTGKLIFFPEKLKSLRSFKVSIENDSVYVEG